jgi:tetratricopeptide (TPR) repeat protein
MPRLLISRFISPGQRELASADAARDRKDWLTAAEWYRKHLKHRPNNFAIWVQLGHAYKEAGRPPDALAAYNEAMRLDGANADLLLNLGHLHKLMGHRRDALGFYRRSAEADGNAHAVEELRRLGMAQGGASIAAVPVRTAPTAPQRPPPRVQPRSFGGGEPPSTSRGGDLQLHQM